MTKPMQFAMPDGLVELAQDVLERAKNSHAKLTTAESCTGGLLAALLTDVEGLSHAFERGFVVYSNEAKCDLLGIERALVDDCGAVSREVAEAMAKGALARSGADVALAITGFAGPAGEKDEEGLVHFGAAHANGDLRHREEHFGAIGRDPVRIAALDTALTMMREALGG